METSIDDLRSTWLLLKESIINYRLNPNENNQDKVLKLSEDIWLQSNNMVYSSQLVSEGKMDRYKISYFFLVINLLLGLKIIVLIRKYVKKSLEKLVNYDELTGIYNRRYFNESLENEILKAERYDRVFSLIIFDVDYFKQVNDTYGYDVGDEVLKGLSDIIVANIRSNDIFARIGGDEFAIIDMETNIENTIKLSEKIRKLVEVHNFKIINKLTISLGVTEFIKGDNKKTIFKRVDTALYCSKRKERNRTEIETVK